MLRNYDLIFLGQYPGITEGAPMYVGSEDSEAFEEMRYDVKVHPIANKGMGQSSPQSSIFIVIDQLFPHNIQI